jgi:hypothetical protein
MDPRIRIFRRAPQFERTNHSDEFLRSASICQISQLTGKIVSIEEELRVSGAVRYTLKALLDESGAKRRHLTLTVFTGGGKLLGKSPKSPYRPTYLLV